METLVILGASGLAKEFFLYIKRSQPQIKEFIFVNDINDGQHEIIISGISYPVVKDWKFDSNHFFTVAVGNPKIKDTLVQKALKSGLIPAPTFVDIDAKILDNTIKLGVGGMISPGCILTTNITIGDYTTLNLNTTVGHDTIIGDFVTTNPGVHISGHCIIGNMNEFGTGSIVRDSVTIGNNKMFGAQSAVVKSTIGDETEIFVGVPIKLLNKK
jgi:sugar O-acyltransferase (sialic acid O-acetyltransferase NeuD family)